MVDALVWTRGSHTLKAGVDYRRPLVRSYNDQFSRGRLSFNNLADLLAGVAAPSSTSIARGATRRDTYTNNIGTFVQDDWKINQPAHPESRPALRVHRPALGEVRHASRTSFRTPAWSAWARDWTRSTNATGTILLRASVSRSTRAEPGRRYCAAPTASITTPPRRTSSWRRAFPTATWAPIPCPGSERSRSTSRGRCRSGPGVDIFGDASTPVPPFTVFGVDQHMRTPYVQSYNFNVQQTIVEGTVLQVGYVGSKGTKLFRVRDINQATARDWRRPCSSAGLSIPLYPRFRRHLSTGGLRQCQLQCSAGCAAQAPLPRT